MDARYEGPNLSRFLSEDPNFINAGAPDWVTGMQSDPTYSGLSGFANSSNVNDLANPQNLNAYSYVDNRPLVYKDPDGKWGTPADYAGVGVGGATYLYLLAANYYQNSQTGQGLFGIFPTPSQVNSDLSQAFQAGSIVAGSRIIGAPLGKIGQAIASGITTFSLLGGYNVTNGYISTGQPGQIDFRNNGLQGSLSYLQDLLPQPGNLYLKPGRPTNMNKAIQPAIRDTITSTLPSFMSTMSTGNTSNRSSAGGGNGTFTFSGFSYPKFFSGITTDGSYARLN
jgi:hypothetical protein